MKGGGEAAASRRPAVFVLALLAASLTAPPALWFFAPAAVAPMLGAVYDHGSPDQRVWAVGRMGALGPAASDPLLLAFADPERSVRRAAKRALARMPAKAVGLRVINALEREPRLDAVLRGLILERPARFGEAILEAGQSPRLGLRRRAFSLLFFINRLPRQASYRALAGEGRGSQSLSWEGFECLRSERFRALLRRGLGDEDRATRLFAMLCLRELSQGRRAWSTRAAAALILDQRSFPDRRARLASWEALVWVPPEVLKAVIAEDPDGRGRRFLRLLTEGFAEETTVYELRGPFFADGEGSGRPCSPFWVPDRDALIAQLPLDRPKVREALVASLEAFRRREPGAWPRAVFFFRPLKIEPDGYVEALAALRAVGFDDLEREGLAVLRGASSPAGRRAFQLSEAEYARRPVIFFDSDAPVTFKSSGKARAVGGP